MTLWSLFFVSIILFTIILYVHDSENGYHHILQAFSVRTPECSPRKNREGSKEKKSVSV